MKSVVNILAVAILLGLTTNTSFALWDHEIVSKEHARDWAWKSDRQQTAPATSRWS